MLKPKSMKFENDILQWVYALTCSFSLEERRNSLTYLILPPCPPSLPQQMVLPQALADPELVLMMMKPRGPV